MTKKRILCFGDSNTWGYTPVLHTRYDEDTRWTSLLQKELGNNYSIVESGINGRTTMYDDPERDFMNGLKALGYELIASKPLDLVIISLGTNDLKFTDAEGSSKGIDKLLEFLESANSLYGSTPVFPNGPKVLVVSPIPLGSNFDQVSTEEKMLGKYRESLRFAEFFKPVCEKHNALFLDASLFAKPSESDCCHMEPESHKALAKAICEMVQNNF